MSLQQCNLIFEEVCKSLQINGASLGDEGVCQMNFKYEWMPAVNFCYIDEDDALLIFAEAGFIEDEGETEILKELMQRHFLFNESKGVTFSIAGNNNAVTVQTRHDVGTMTVENLQNTLVNFVKEVRYAVKKVNREYQNISEDDLDDTLVNPEMFG